MFVDPQPARRAVHVCADGAVGRLVASAAERHHMLCARFDDAFAAAVELLAHPGQPSLLLVALDGLSRPEIPLLAWAAERWPDMPIWAYGSAARLNGHLADARVKMVRIERLDGLLAEYAARAAALADIECDGRARQAGGGAALAAPTEEDTATSASCESDESHEAAPSAAEGDAIQAGLDDAIVQGLVHGEQVDEKLHRSGERTGPDAPGQADASSAPGFAAPPLPETPALKLHPPQVALGPTLTTEELAVLLGPEESGDN